MNDIRNKLSRIRRRLWFELRKDGRKTTVAGILAALVIVLGLKLAVSGPSSSSAADASGAETLAVDEDEVRAAVEAGSWEQSNKAEYLSKIDRDIQRDIFRADPSTFPYEDDRALGDGSLESVEDEDIEESRRRRVEGEAQSLRLQSTAISATSTAIINGKVLMKGETINGFRVVEIKPHACLIEKEGVRVRLRMKR